MRRRSCLIGSLSVLLGPTLMTPWAAAQAPARADVESCLARVKEFHGGGGPWAVLGFRMGERALKETGRPRGSFELLVVHHCPKQVQYACVADGLHAATGASLGKLNLRIEEAPADKLRTVVHDRAQGKRITFLVKADLIRSILDLPWERLETEGRRVAGLPDDALFELISDRPADPGP